MIDLNIINDNDKRTIKKIKLYYLFKNISFVMMSGIVITSVIFGFTYFILDGYSETLNDQIATELVAQQELALGSTEDATIELNDKLIRVKQIQDDFITWTPFIYNLLEKIPSGIIISDLSFDSIKMSFVITGNASTREQLLSLQQNLETFPYFSGITYPLSNLAQKENIDFEIAGKITQLLYE